MNDLLTEKETRVVMEILAEELDVGSEQLTPDARLVEDLGADSLTIIQIAMAIEERFGLSVPDARWEGVKTVGDVLDALAELLPEQRR
jgi:acyl carrier protein